VDVECGCCHVTAFWFVSSTHQPILTIPMCEKEPKRLLRTKWTELQMWKCP